MGEKWRTGRSVGRTIYIGDTLVGLMDTPELAELVVAAVNSVHAVPEIRVDQTIRKFCTHCWHGEHNLCSGTPVRAQIMSP